MLASLRSNPGRLGLALLGLSACGALTLKGASSHKGGPPPSSQAQFLIPSCRDVATGAQAPGSPSRYFMAPGAGVFDLYEVDQAGKGLRITNYWKDEQGHHWHYFERNREAYAFLLPDARDQVGWRYVYPKGSYQPPTGNSGFRITGTHRLECAMIPVDAQGNPLAQPGGEPQEDADAGAPEAAAPQPERFCAPGQTQECVGPGACAGGQSCLPDGSGFGPCDCGPGDAGAGADAEASDE